jgi:hypothetical protein
MSVDWRHRFEDNLPLYMQVSMDDLILHLSEHSGDSTPGTKLLVHTNQLQSLFDQIKQKNIVTQNPRLQKPIGAPEFSLLQTHSQIRLLSVKFNSQ